MPSTDKMIGKRKFKSYVIVVSRLLGEPYLHITQRERGRRPLLTEWLHKYNSRYNATTNAFRDMIMIMMMMMMMLMTEGWL